MKISYNKISNTKNKQVKISRNLKLCQIEISDKNKNK